MQAYLVVVNLSSQEQDLPLVNGVEEVLIANTKVEQVLESGKLAPLGCLLCQISLMKQMKKLRNELPYKSRSFSIEKACFAF